MVHFSGTKEFDLSSSTIKGEINCSELHVPCALNLCHSQLTHPLNLHNVHIDFHRERYLYIFSRATNQEDAACFRRLKKLAKDASDHERSIDFFAKEMRADYWHEITGLKLFSLLSL